MPNVKVYVDEALLDRNRAKAEALPAAIRSFLCGALGVTEAACHIVLVAARSPADQTPVNVEVVLMRRPDRTAEGMADFCGRLRDLTAAQIGAQAAVRCALMEPEHYIVAR